MKKSKILVPAIALLALGVAGSATGTVAWFQIGTLTPTVGTTPTGTVASTTDFDQTGSFVVSAVDGGVKVAQSAISLTNSLGETYLWDGTSNIKAPDQAIKYSEVTVDMSIAYEGALNDADAIKNLWMSSVASHAVTIKVEDKSLASDTVVPEGKTKCVTGGGLKLSAGADTVVAATVGAELTGVTTVLGDSTKITFSTPTEKSGSTGVYQSSATINAAATFYVAIAGVDGVEQKATDYYLMKVSPVIA